MRIPIRFLGQSLIDAIIKVLVMREDDMTTNIKQLEAQFSVSDLPAILIGNSANTHESLGGDICRCETAWRLV
jgi:hypothetical protein